MEASKFEIFLIRHTKIAALAGLCIGQSDVPLADSFPEEMKALGQNLKMVLGWDDRNQESFNPIILTSPLGRCRLLAEILEKELSSWLTIQIPVIESDLLKEVNFGRWEYQPWQCIPADEIAPWYEDFVNTAPPGGESFRQLSERVAKVVSQIKQNAFCPSSKVQSQTILCVTHAGVIRAMVCGLLGLPLKEAFKLSVDYGSITSIVFDGQLQNLGFLNRRSV